MTKNYNQIADQITQTFENHFGFMRTKYQYHFCLRAFRISLMQKYIQPILVDFQYRTLYQLPKIFRLQDSEFLKLEPQRLLEYYPSHTPKQLARKSVYEKEPQILLWGMIAHYLFLAKSFSMDTIEEFKPFYDAGVAALKRIDLESVFLNKGMLAENPTGSANNVYYLKYIGAANLEDVLLAGIKKTSTPRKKDGLGFKIYIYGLTHLIIAASYYYQELANPKKFRWILNIFEENQEEILGSTNADIVAEVGLCFRLTGMADHPMISKCQEFVVSKFNSQLGYIPREDRHDSWEKLEHRNALAILLLADYKDLSRGPNLALFIQEKKRFFFIPTKGVSVGHEEVGD